MEKQEWYKQLSDEQLILVKIATGLMDDVINIFELLEKNMTEDNFKLCKIGYIETLGCLLGIWEEKK